SAIQSLLNMGAPLHSQLLLSLCSLSLLLLSFKVQLTYPMSTITAMAKDQIACTMCSSCDNPCQPIFSPPPPSPLLPCPPPLSPPLPPPLPPPSDYNYPPPPSPPSSCPGDCSQPLSPPYNGGGGRGDGNYVYPPTNPSIYPTPPPPNPIVPYFPFYYYNPPPPDTLISKSIQFQSHPFITCLILAMAIFLLL
uniref:Leucine-rich repeat extensin-like protein 3 n=1 Tax=Nicotiana tabacum TaxID=4097 RepID=A0A1S4DQN2_TOBAC